jgi:hypothetical protein
MRGGERGTSLPHGSHKIWTILTPDQTRMLLLYAIWEGDHILRILATAVTHGTAHHLQICHIFHQRMKKYNW